MDFRELGSNVVHGRFSSIPDEVKCLFALALFAGLAHWAAWYYFDFSVAAWAAAVEAAVAGVVGAAYKFLPKVETWLKDVLLKLFRSDGFRYSLYAGCLVLLVVGCSWCRIGVHWKGQPVDVVVDGAKTTIGEVGEESGQSHSVWSLHYPFFDWSYRKMRLAVGHYFIRETNFRPFARRDIDIPEQALLSTTVGYNLRIRMLAVAFYGATPGKYLDKAKRELGTDTDKLYPELRSVHRVLMRCFANGDRAEAERTAAQYAAEYKYSAWNPLLTACLSHARRDYVSAIEALKAIPDNADSPLRETFMFFRAANRLQLFKEQTSNDKRDPVLVKSLHDDLEVVENLVSNSKFGDDFGIVAPASAQIFQGIADIYEGDLSKAEASFLKARTSPNILLRGRALNDLAYLHAIKGDHEPAIKYLIEGLASDRDNPQLIFNLGTVHLDAGRYADVERYYKRLVDEKKFSEADEVVLAKIVLAYIASEAAAAPGNPAAFDNVLSELKIYNYEESKPLSLRLALISQDLATHVANSEKYQGLEFLAMALYARAYLGAKRLADDGNIDAVLLRNNAREGFERMRKRNGIWVKYERTNGFFKPVFEMMRAP